MCPHGMAIPPLSQQRRTHSLYSAPESSRTGDNVVAAAAAAAAALAAFLLPFFPPPLPPPLALASSLPSATAAPPASTLLSSRTRLTISLNAGLRSGKWCQQSSTSCFKPWRAAPPLSKLSSCASGRSAKNGIFEPFIYKYDHFAKTGSGQT
jgi:hypothetical protein